MLDLAPI